MAIFEDFKYEQYASQSKYNFFNLHKLHLCHIIVTSNSFWTDPSQKFNVKWVIIEWAKNNFCLLMARPLGEISSKSRRHFLLKMPNFDRCLGLLRCLKIRSFYPRIKTFMSHVVLHHTNVLTNYF